MQPKQTRTIRNEPNKLAKSKFPSPAKDLIMMRTHGRAFEGKVAATRTSMEENNRDLSWKQKSPKEHLATFDSPK